MHCPMTSHYTQNINRSIRFFLFYNLSVGGGVSGGGVVVRIKGGFLRTALSLIMNMMVMMTTSIFQHLRVVMNDGELARGDQSHNLIFSSN